MTHIDSDEHCATLAQCLRELHEIQVSACFRINLSQYVGCFGQIKGICIPEGDHLGWDLVLVHDFLEAGVVALTVEDADHSGWVLESST